MNIPSILNTSAYRAVTLVQGCADRQLTVVENKLPQGIQQHRWHQRDLEPINIII